MNDSDDGADLGAADGAPAATGDAAPKRRKLDPEARHQVRTIRAFYDLLEGVDTGMTASLAAHLAEAKSPPAISQFLTCLRQASASQLKRIGECPVCLRVFANWLKVRLRQHYAAILLLARCMAASADSYS